MTNEVITSKFVQRDMAGYIVGVEVTTNRKRTFKFDGRAPALWANSHYQRLQTMIPADITAKHTVEK